ncbi:phosphate acyltransferase PlsX [Mesoplasma corruscae]|uniref:Phosphate acyltransferase n=1 Tax=Mesoplasma corruscae TaxID=216874 RepID=A0A2S5RGK9_9MOLU|nr:phosphate acyltransferase PlsX [Mesoplasma corruscae]PPE06443.1 glycerol-3-phosphate acyltransferase PlsX [Mesoplasma corruscae]
MYKIGYDVMGSDNGVEVAIQAASEFIKTRKELFLVFVGNEEEIKTALTKYKIDSNRFSIYPTTEFIDMHGSIMDIRRKRNSSMVKVLELLKAKEIDAMITAGNSAAFIAGSHFILGEIEGIKRAGFMPTIPTAIKNKVTLLLDVGANMECDEEDLLGFAKMATVYSQEVLKVSNPQTTLLNIGVEETKGTLLQKEAFKALSSDPFINFLGNMEAREILSGQVDIIITDGYTGNMALKSLEGSSKILMNEIKKELTSSFIKKIKALTLKKSFKAVSEKFDYKNHSGALLIGVDGIAFKSHGSSDVKSWKATLRMTCDAVENDVLNKIKRKAGNF